MPGTLSGSVIHRKTAPSRAPRERAASPSLSSMDVSEEKIGNTAYGRRQCTTPTITANRLCSSGIGPPVRPIP